MSQPEFENPDFLDDVDSDVIQERMMENLPEDISNIEGDFPFDFTMPTAIELSELLTFTIPRAIMVAFPEYAWDEWLDLHGQRAHVIRQNAVAATGSLTITADAGVSIPAGTLFAVPSTSVNDAIEFESDEDLEFTTSGTKTVGITAAIAGTEGNVLANTIVIMSSPIDGVVSITNPEATSGGTDEEDDDAYYDRIHTAYESQMSYVGNDTDFIRWAQSIDGVGTVIVDTPAAGEVKLYVADTTGTPASTALCTAVYNYIVSPNDRSARLLPTACATLTVEPVAAMYVTFACTGLVLDDITIADVKTAFTKAIAEAFRSAKSDDVLRYNAARTAMASIEGVTDFGTFTMNDQTANITLDASEFPAIKALTFEEEG